MDEAMKNTVTEEEIEGQMSFEEEGPKAEPDSTDGELKTVVEEQLRKVQRQNLLIGAQTMCKVVLEKIILAERQPGKRTMNDYKRLVKDIRRFCEVGLSRKVNADGTTEPVEENAETETAQN